MSALSEYFLEVVDRSGLVRERVSLNRTPVILGRAYDCQVIIEDPYVCPQHIQISLAENGELLIEDLDSLNGLSISKHGAKQSQLKLRPGEDCFIGWTKLRFRCRDEQVVPARHDHSRQLVFSLLQQPKFLAIIMVLTFFQLIFSGWLDQSRQVELHTLLVAPASIYLFLIAWALVWSVVGKLLVHRACFFTHFSIAVAMISLTLIIDGATGYSLFMLDMDLLQIKIQLATGFIVTAIILYAHLHFATRARPKNQLVTAIFVSAIFTMLLAYIDYEEKDEFSSLPAYSVFLKPPMFVIGPVQTTDDFLSGMDVVERKVDVLKSLKKFD